MSLLFNMLSRLVIAFLPRSCCCCHFSTVQLCETPQTEAHQAPPSLGFSSQEHWSGVPFHSPIHESEKWKWSCSVVSNSSRPHGLQPTRSSVHGIFQARVLEWSAIAFSLPRSKHLLISWLQSPSAVILEPKKIKSLTVSTVSPDIFHEVMRPDAMILVFRMLSFKPTFSTLLFHFHQQAL